MAKDCIKESNAINDLDWEIRRAEDFEYRRKKMRSLEKSDVDMIEIAYPKLPNKADEKNVFSSKVLFHYAGISGKVLFRENRYKKHSDFTLYFSEPPEAKILSEIKRAGLIWTDILNSFDYPAGYWMGLEKDSCIKYGILRVLKERFER